MTTSSEKPVPNSWNKKKPPGEFEVFLKRLMKTKWKYWQSPDIPEDRKPEFIPFYAPHIAAMVFKNKWLQTETWQGKDRVFSKGRNNYCDGIIRSIFFLFYSFWLLIFPLPWYPSPQKKKSVCLPFFISSSNLPSSVDLFQTQINPFSLLELFPSTSLPKNDASSQYFS